MGGFLHNLAPFGTAANNCPAFRIIMQKKDGWGVWRMGYLDNRFRKRERKSRRNYAIDDRLLQRLIDLTSVYEVSVSELVNVAITRLVETENVALYKRSEHENSVIRTFFICESNLSGLEVLRSKFGLSIFMLVNIAIRNLIEEKE